MAILIKFFENILNQCFCTTYNLLQLLSWKISLSKDLLSVNNYNLILVYKAEPRAVV